MQQKRQWMQEMYSTEEGKRLLEQERVLLEAQEAMCELMEAQGVSRAELAKRMEVSPAYITKLLRGTNNFTLRKLADVFYCLGRAAHVEHTPLEPAIVSPYTPSAPTEQDRKVPMELTCNSRAENPLEIDDNEFKLAA